jgi:hypothetical protein
MEVLVNSKVADEIGRDHMFVTMHDAVKWCLDHLDGATPTVKDEVASEVEEIEGDTYES